MAIRLVVTRIGESGPALAELSFDKDSISVGRAKDCDVSLKDPAKAIAPTHGFIQKVGEDYFFIDYGSQIGTTIDGKQSRAHEMTALPNGARIAIGSYQLAVAMGPGKPATRATSARRRRTVEDPGTVLSIDPGAETGRKVTDRTNVDVAADESPVKAPGSPEVVEEDDVAGLTMALSDFSSADLKKAADELKRKEASKSQAPEGKKRQTKARTRADIKKRESEQVVEDVDLSGLTMDLADLRGDDLKKAAAALSGEGPLPKGKKRETGTRQIDDLLSRISSKEKADAAFALPEDESPKVSDSLQGAAFAALQAMSDALTGRGPFETKEQIDLFGKLAQQTLDITLEWLNKSLKGRSEFEGQFEAFVTMALSREKNPIKQVKDAMEVRRMPLDWKSGKSPEQLKKQLVDAFRDLTQHQLGLMEGVQRAINEIMKRLDPKAIEEEANKNASGLFKSLGGEKRAWRQYALTYSELLGESGKLFNEVIFPNMRKGYLESHTKEPGAATTSHPPADKGDKA